MQKDDMISRQAAIDVLDVVAEFLRHVLDVVELVGAEREKCEWGLGLIEAQILDIKELPPAQPERAEGEWVPHKSIFGCLGEKVYTCNQCGYNIGFHTENFCPKCGADMRGEQE